MGMRFSTKIGTAKSVFVSIVLMLQIDAEIGVLHFTNLRVYIKTHGPPLTNMV